MNTAAKVGLIAIVGLAGLAAVPQEAELTARARAIHERVITLDTHNDVDPGNFTRGCNYTMPLTTADVVSISKSGRKVAVIGIENGYPIGTDVNRVKEFWQRGGRYMSLAHNGHSQLSDSNTGEADNKWSWGGLSPLGRQVIQEMNKWGIMVDVSHPSKGSMMQAIGLSKAPVIASHSAVRTLGNHSRNLDDEMLMAIKTNGGVAQIVAFASYVKTDPAERGPAIAALRREFALPAGRGGGPGAGRGGAAPAAPPPCPIEGATPSAAGQ